MQGGVVWHVKQSASWTNAENEVWVKSCHVVARAWIVKLGEGDLCMWNQSQVKLGIQTHNAKRRVVLVK